MVYSSLSEVDTNRLNIAVGENVVGEENAPQLVFI